MADEKRIVDVLFDQPEPILGIDLFTKAMVADVCGTTPESISNWRRQELVVPSIRTGTKGQDPLYSFADLFLATIVKALKDGFVPPEVIWRVCQEFEGAILETQWPCLVVYKGDDWKVKIVPRAVARRIGQLGTAKAIVDLFREAAKLKEYCIKAVMAEAEDADVASETE